MSTNEDKAFEPGEVIIWCEEEYIVLENYGNSGNVKYNIEGDNEEIGNFYWNYCGTIAERKTN